MQNSPKWLHPDAMSTFYTLASTMADSIWEISKFSDDIVQLAINSFLINNADRKKFEENLKEIILKTVRERKKSKKRRKVDTNCLIPNDMTIFYERIFPHIRENIAKYKEMENIGESVEWKADLNFVEEFISATKTQFATDPECSYEENNWYFSDDVDKTLLDDDDIQTFAECLSEMDQDGRN